jgi:hypothetical protein
MLPISAVQRAIYEALTPALAPVPVLDMAGPDQMYPYVTIGECTCDQDDPLLGQGVNLEATIHTWSRYPGMAEAQTLMETVRNTLDRQRFPITDAQWVDTIWIFAQTLRDPDGVTRHGVLRFRVLTFQPAEASARPAITNNQPGG